MKNLSKMRMRELENIITAVVPTRNFLLIRQVSPAARNSGNIRSAPPLTLRPSWDQLLTSVPPHSL